MSSRALRKAQRQKEEQLPNVSEDRVSEVDSEEDSKEPVSQSKQSLFALLQTDDAKIEDSDDEEEDEPATQAAPPSGSSAKKAESSTKPKAKKKKKKKKAKAHDASSLANNETIFSGHASQEESDDIEKAVRELNLRQSQSEADKTSVRLSPDDEELAKLLSIDFPCLRPENEMKRLFGKAALGSVDNEAEPQVNGRRGTGRGRSGRVPKARGMGARDLATLGLRRNIFVQGKEEWPKASSGGLGMARLGENEERGTIKYVFTHNGAYADVQKQFLDCVYSMDPERLIMLLQFNPYHVSTLLQCSEIAKQQQDHSTSGDLLERALYSFGKAIHSSFSAALSSGTARLDFETFENRELWLAGHRYIHNLGMKGTWRTAYEWAKLLLSLSPDEDPYQIVLIIDQLALKAQLPDHFLQLCANPRLFDSWIRQGIYPNIKLSRVLALFKTGASTECRKALQEAIFEYPWVFCRLFQELGIDNVPPAIWGAEPPTDRAHVMSELYIIRAVDLWKAPEVIAMLTGIAAHVVKPDTAREVDMTEIGLNEARHIMMTENPKLIALLPRWAIKKATASFDPLPPGNSDSESESD